MNKQEAIRRMQREQFQVPYGPGIFVHAVFSDKAIELINQIHEPQEVVVPKFVAEWIDTLDEHGLFGLNYDVVVQSVWDWVYENYDCNAKKLHLAYLYGYEIEQEKLYTVEIPNPVLTDNSDSVTVLMKTDLGVVLTDVVNYIGRKQEPVYQLTEAEIKQDFEWAWQFREEVE